MKVLEKEWHTFTPEGNKIVEVAVNLVSSREVRTPNPEAFRGYDVEFVDHVWELALQMPHQCDEWVIGNVSEGKALVAEIFRAIRAIENGDVVMNPKGYRT